MNAHAERFHRTMQEEMIGDQEESLFQDLGRFNHALCHHLNWYNSVRPHASLGQRPPMAALDEADGETCNMSWVHTVFE